MNSSISCMESLVFTILRKGVNFTIITERMKEAEVTEKKGNDVRRAR